MEYKDDCCVRMWHMNWDKLSVWRSCRCAGEKIGAIRNSFFKIYFLFSIYSYLHELCRADKKEESVILVLEWKVAEKLK